jgi:lactoylglutathione lyase
MAIKYNGYLIVLFVKDFGRSRDFYENVMGMEYKHGEDGTDGYFQLGADGMLLISHDIADDLLSPAAVDHEPSRGARSVLVAEVEDVDAAYAELIAKGVEFIQPPQDREWGLRCTHLKDPDGNVWELHTPIRASEAAE